ncbi:MAG: hypothetical protein WCC12_19525 [Anaerolineales bacterium]
MGRHNRGNKSVPNPTTRVDNSEPPTIKIIVAIIAAIATVVVAVIGFFGDRQGAILPIEATQTAETLHTSVALTNQTQPLLNVFTITPSLTADPSLLTFTPSPTQPPALSERYAISRGLSAECFDIQYWTPQYAAALSTDPNHCWILNGWNMHPQDQGFRIFTGPTDNVVSHWLYTPVPPNARIAFTINISDFRTIDGVFGNLVFGFGKSSEDFLTGKFLVYRVIQARSRIYIQFGDPVSHEKTAIPYIKEYPKNTDQKVVLVLKAISLEVYLDGEMVVNQSLSTDEQQLFWMGFRLPQAGALNATVSDFEIK